MDPPPQKMNEVSYTCFRDGIECAAESPLQELGG
jgi:hypothetical protein